MLELLLYCMSFALGTSVGYLSGRTLIRQASVEGYNHTRSFTLLPFIRILFIGAIGGYLLRWGAIPFILFGVSTVCALWLVIVTFDD